MKCKNGIYREFFIPYSDCNVIPCARVSDRIMPSLRAPSRIFSEIFQHFAYSTTEATLWLCENYISFKTFIENDDVNYYNIPSTSFSYSSRDFNLYNHNTDITITFNVRDIKPFMDFALHSNQQVNVFLQNDSKPIEFMFNNNSDAYSSLIIVATIQCPESDQPVPPVVSNLRTLTSAAPLDQSISSNSRSQANTTENETLNYSTTDNSAPQQEDDSDDQNFAQVPPEQEFSVEQEASIEQQTTNLRSEPDDFVISLVQEAAESPPELNESMDDQIDDLDVDMLIESNRMGSQAPNRIASASGLSAQGDSLRQTGTTAPLQSDNSNVSQKSCNIYQDQYENNVKREVVTSNESSFSTDQRLAQVGGTPFVRANQSRNSALLSNSSIVQQSHIEHFFSSSSENNEESGDLTNVFQTLDNIDLSSGVAQTPSNNGESTLSQRYRRFIGLDASQKKENNFVIFPDSDEDF